MSVQSRNKSDFKSGNSIRYQYYSPHEEAYSVFRNNKWISKKRTKLSPTFISAGINMLDQDQYDERPWDEICTDAKNKGLKELPCVVHIAYCQGIPVKMNCNVCINSIVVETVLT